MKHISFEEALEAVRAAEKLSPAERAELRKHRLDELVTYARSHSPYFKQLYSALLNAPALQELPITEKSHLQPSLNDWVTDSDVTYEKAAAHLNDKASDLLLGKYSVLTTSGTTGEPLVMIRDSYHNMLHGAMIQTRLLKDLPPDIMQPIDNRIAAVIATDPSVSSYSSLLRMMKSYPEYQDNVLPISILLPVSEIVQKLNDFQPNLLTGYPSMLTLLAKEQTAGNLQISPSVIACSAETLSPEAYQLLKEAFQCRVINNYCSTEGGEIAMSCKCGELHINDDWLIVEAVDENGNPVKDGEVSKGALITDLTNFIQPIIRYHLDDNICIRNEPCPCGSTFPTVQVFGRACDTLKVCGVALPSVIFAFLMHNYNEVLSYQFAQVAEDRIEFRSVLDKNTDIQDFQMRLQKDVEAILQANGCSRAQFTFSSDLPKNSREGGKRKVVVNEYSK